MKKRIYKKNRHSSFGVVACYMSILNCLIFMFVHIYILGVPQKIVFFDKKYFAIFCNPIPAGTWLLIVVWKYGQPIGVDYTLVIGVDCTLIQSIEVDCTLIQSIGVDCTLLMFWQLGRYLPAFTRRGIACRGLKKNHNFLEHLVVAAL